MKKSLTTKFTILFFLFVLAIVLIFLNSQNFLAFKASDTPRIEEPKGNTVVSVNNYKVYDLEDVPFRFIIANIKISSSRDIYFDLNRFTTDEGISLHQIDEYRQQITNRGYDLSLANITTNLVSSENELNASILIPVKNRFKQKSFLEISGLTNNQLQFDLSNHFGKAQDLGKSNPTTNEEVPATPMDEEVIEVNPDTEVSNEISFNSANLINKDLVLYKGATGYHRIDFSDRVRILLLSVNMDFDHEVTVTAARINFQNNNLILFALGPEFVNENGKNILLSPMTQGQGNLIFQIDDPLFDVVNQPYNLEVRTSDNNDWQVISFNQ